MRFIFFILCVLQISGFELYIPPLPIPEDLRSELSIVMDGDRNMIAVWLENGVVYVSDLPQEGAWTIPSPLSSILKKSASPRMAIEASGKTTVIWIEENSIKSATRARGKNWSISTLEPSILEASPSEGKSRLSVNLSPLSEVEPAEGALATLQVTRGKASEGFGLELKSSKDLEDFDPALLPMANAIDAPTSTILSGAQIGFAAGTAAPANGLVVSGQAGFGASSLTANRQVQITASVSSVSSAGYGLILTGGTYTATANNDSFYQIRASTATIATTASNYTGINFYNIIALNSVISKSGGGTVATAYGIYSDAFNTLATTQYGLYVARPTGGTNNYTAYFDTIVGIGYAPVADRCLYVGGSVTATTGNTYGLVINTGLGASSGTVTSAVTCSISPQFNSNAATVTTAYGCWIDAGSTAGTVTTGYGLYVQKPTYGTNKYTAYFDPIVGIGTSPLADRVLAIGGNIVQTVSNYGLVVAPSVGASSGTITSATGLYVSANVGSNVGTISNLYGIYVDSNSTGGTVTTSYGLFVAKPSAGTNKYTAYFDNNIGIGNVPTSYIGLWNGGGVTSTSASVVQGFRNSPTLGCTSGTMSACYSMYNYADFSLNSATITSAYGLYIDVGNTAGTITNGYGLYVTNPAYGTNQYTAYFDPICGIGSILSNVNFYVTGNITQTNSNYGVFVAPTLGASSGTVPEVAQIYVLPTYAGTVTTAYGMLIAAGSSSGSVSTAYGLYVSKPTTTNISNSYTAYFDSVVSVGQTPFVNVSLNNAGTLTGTAGDLHGTRNACDLGASSGTVTNSYQMSVNPQHTSNAGTISFAYGLVVFGGSTAGTITNGFNLYVSSPAYGTNKYCAVFDGLVIPGGNKANNLGATGSRWNTIYYVTATTGTSRLANSRTMCGYCNQVMKRGTGTTYTLGEDADYIPVFCTECGAQKVEKIQHLPRARLLERLPAPKIEFLGFKVNQFSGHSRGIQVLYRYVDKEADVPLSGKENSTFLSESEYEQFLSLTESGQRAYLKELGQREWDAMEEVRLMKEECSSLQEQLDAIGDKWVGKDLLTEEL